jgi:hypothetical protein
MYEHKAMRKREKTTSQLTSGCTATGWELGLHHGKMTNLRDKNGVTLT